MSSPSSSFSSFSDYLPSPNASPKTSFSDLPPPPSSTSSIDSTSSYISSLSDDTIISDIMDESKLNSIKGKMKDHYNRIIDPTLIKVGNYYYIITKNTSDNNFYLTKVMCDAPPDTRSNLQNVSVKFSTGNPNNLKFTRIFNESDPNEYSNSDNYEDYIWEKKPLSKLLRSFTSAQSFTNEPLGGRTRTRKTRRTRRTRKTRRTRRTRTTRRTRKTRKV